MQQLSCLALGIACGLEVVLFRQSTMRAFPELGLSLSKVRVRSISAMACDLGWIRPTLFPAAGRNMLGWKLAFITVTTLGWHHFTPAADGRVCDVQLTADCVPPLFKLAPASTDCP
jgi:hypothetical protein